MPVPEQDERGPDGVMECGSCLTVFIVELEGDDLHPLSAAADRLCGGWHGSPVICARCSFPVCRGCSTEPGRRSNIHLSCAGGQPGVTGRSWN